jgi:hypothetical protein
VLSEAEAIGRLLTGALLAGEGADASGMHRHVFKVLNPPRAIGWWRQVRFGFTYPIAKPACNPAASFAFYSDATTGLDGPHMRITVVPRSLISLVAFGLTLSGSVAA